MKIVETNARIRATMNKLLAKEGDKALRNASPRIKRRVKALVLQAMAASKEISEISSGSLRLDFGLTQDPTAEIINAIVNSVYVEVRRVRATAGKLSGGVTIGIQPMGYQNLLTLPGAQQQIEDGSSLPWLSWLLTRGNEIIIQEYGVLYGSGFGRTDGAKMSNKKAPFMVDPAYSGTADNNFITRALAPHQRAISNIIKEELTR
jgi:hypothetical protein